tara:strand:+ start:272 stop:454 length:183 start_codon:yes stop_codon:yes gene_type:complete
MTKGRAYQRYPAHFKRMALAKAVTDLDQNDSSSDKAEKIFLTSKYHLKWKLKWNYVNIHN